MTGRISWNAAWMSQIPRLKDKPLRVVALEPAVITIYHRRSESAGSGPLDPLSAAAAGDTCGCVVVYPRCSVEHQTWIRGGAGG